MDISDYSEHPGSDPTLVFPRESIRLLCLITLLLALSAIFYILGKRTSQLNPFLDNSWSALNIARLSCLGVYILSAAYVFGGLVVTFGTGLSKSPETCNTASLLCLCFYTVSKSFLYLFLTERVRIVQAVKIPRLKSRSYMAMIVALTIPCTAILILMIFGRRTDIDSNHVCHMGLELYSSLPVLAFDVLLVGYLTFSFTRPLLQTKPMVSPMIRRVALKSLIAAVTSITGTAINVIYLAIRQRKLAAICLLTCTLDIVASVVVLFFVTGRTDSEGSSNGNAEREQQAIRALGRSKMPSGLAGSLRSHGHGDHLDMLEALAGDLRVGESTVVAHDPRPALVCRCSSTSCRSDSDDVVERRPSAVAAKASSLSSSDIELAPVNALSYQAPPSASSSIDSGLPTPPSPRTPSSGPLPRP